MILAAVSPPKNEVTPCFTLANEGIVWLVQYRLVAKNANRLGRHDRFTHFWLTVDLLIYSDPLITSYYHTIPTFDPYVQMRLHHWSRLFKWAFHGILTVHLGVDGRNVRFKDTDSVGLLTSNFKNQSRPGYPRFMYIINSNFIYIYIYKCVRVRTFRSNAFQRHQLRYSCLSVYLNCGPHTECCSLVNS